MSRVLQRNPSTTDLLMLAVVTGVVLWVSRGWLKEKASEGLEVATEPVREAWRGFTQCPFDAQNYVAPYRDGWIVVINGYLVSPSGWSFVSGLWDKDANVFMRQETAEAAYRDACERHLIWAWSPYTPPAN